jgi:hypothetical protein
MPVVSALPYIPKRMKGQVFFRASRAPKARGLPALRIICYIGRTEDNSRQVKFSRA